MRFGADEFSRNGDYCALYSVDDGSANPEASDSGSNDFARVRIRVRVRVSLVP